MKLSYCFQDESKFHSVLLNSIDSKAHSGICFPLGSSKSASFHFISKKQSLVTRSSNEAEIYAVDFGMHDIEYFRQILYFLRCPQSSPTIIYEDNESSISMLSRKTKISTKSSHIFWRYNYALQAIDQGTAIMKWISTSEQIADILTKRIKPNNQFFKLRSMILNCNNSKHGN